MTKKKTSIIAKIKSFFSKKNDNTDSSTANAENNAKDSNKKVANSDKQNDRQNKSRYKNNKSESSDQEKGSKKPYRSRNGKPKNTQKTADGKDNVEFLGEQEASKAKRKNSRPNKKKVDKSPIIEDELLSSAESQDSGEAKKPSKNSRRRRSGNKNKNANSNVVELDGVNIRIEERDEANFDSRNKKQKSPRQNLKQRDKQPDKRGRKKGAEAESHSEHNTGDKKKRDKVSIKAGNSRYLTKKDKLPSGAIIGTIDAKENFAFLIPDDKEQARSDIFIPSIKLNNAIHGDKVAIMKTTFKGKIEGRVIKIVERSKNPIIGYYSVTDQLTVVSAMDKKVTEDIVVRGYAPELVSQYNFTPPRAGDIVAIQLDNNDQALTGVITSIIGSWDDLGVENKITLIKYGLTTTYNEEASKNADEVIAKYKVDESNRTDFTNVITFTIDGEKARDFDDAISIDFNEATGDYTLFVHIADVAHFVRPNSLIDVEAYKRSTSVYFPEFVVPMLTESLANDICSLMPQQRRFTMTAEIMFDKNGERTDCKIHQGIIFSDQRLTYTIVNQYFKKLDNESDEYSNLEQKIIPDVEKKLLIARELAKKIKSIKVKNGFIEFRSDEAVFELDERGNILDIKVHEQAEAEQLIEMFMISANEAVAEILEDSYDEAIYRVHGQPDTLKLDSFLALLTRNNIDYPELPDIVTPLSVQSIANAINQSEHSTIFSPLLIRTMMKAEYHPKNQGHFGLSSNSYTHFTSPIRRYPDLIVHRLLKHLIFNYELSNEEIGKLTEQAKHCSIMEISASSAEIENTLYKKIKYIKKFFGTPLNGIVTKIAKAHIGVYIESVLITANVELETLLNKNERTAVEFDPETNTLKVGKRTFAVGARVKVIPISTNIDNKEVFAMIDDSNNDNDD